MLQDSTDATQTHSFWYLLPNKTWLGRVGLQACGSFVENKRLLARQRFSPHIEYFVHSKSPNVTEDV